MASADAQKSEIHDETADASSSPAAGGDAKTTRVATGHGHTSGPGPRDIPRSAAQTIITSDQSADGGPIEIQSQEPDLQKVQAPQDPFPTDGVADADVVSEADRPAKLRSTAR